MLAAFLIGVSGGCDGSDSASTDRLEKEAYLSELTRIGEQMQDAVDDSVDSGFAPSRLLELADVLDAKADELASTPPPAVVQTAHDLLVSGLRDMAADIGELEGVIEESKSLEPIDAIDALSKVQENDTLQRAVDEFRGAGYSLPPGFGERSP